VTAERLLWMGDGDGDGACLSSMSVVDDEVARCLVLLALALCTQVRSLQEQETKQVALLMLRLHCVDEGQVSVIYIDRWSFGSCRRNCSCNCGEGGR
jgi:hypothetical protein